MRQRHRRTRVGAGSGPGPGPGPGPSASASADACAGSGAKRLLALIGTAALVVVADHLTKFWVVQRLPLGVPTPPGGLIILRHVENRGAAFGLFPQFQGLFLIVAVAVAAYILRAGHRFGDAVWRQAVLGLVLGGAVSNAVDRFLQGYVVDFIDLRHWPVFNVADMAIVGGILVAVATFRSTNQPTSPGPSPLS